jgi:23S rRNA (uridine2552-2'-O)-methyltransferase
MNWRKKQSRERFYQLAKNCDYRARSAFKLIEVDHKFQLFHRNLSVIDLGCAPGSWMQVAMEARASLVVGLDLQPIKPITGTHFAQLDFLDRVSVDNFLTKISGPSKLYKKTIQDEVKTQLSKPL